MDGEWIWVLVPGLALLIPIVAMLTKHQQRMAEILNRGVSDQQEAESIRRELADLKALVHQQTIALDDLAGRGSLVAGQTPDLPKRLGSGS